MEAADITQNFDGESGDAQVGSRAPAHLPGFEPERRTKLALDFVIPGEPKGKGRARSRIAKMGDGRQFVTHYTPKDTVEYENLVRMAAHEAMEGEAPTRFPCLVSIAAYCSVPASWSNKRRALALAGEILPTGKPDLDNTEKAVLDGMSKIVFLDDSVVCDVTKRKRYSETPRVEVVVRELDANPAS
jgi:Holliday junction resolvase RusA-like endonuclease